MRVDISGEETLACTQQQLWISLNDPEMLMRCIPGCSEMIEIAPDIYNLSIELKVAAVGGTFEGELSLSDKIELSSCRISIFGEGTLGQGNGEASFEISANREGQSILRFEGISEINGLVAGVGQRVLSSVSKHLVKRFFKTFREELQKL